MLRGDWVAVDLEGAFGQQLIDVLNLHPCKACVRRRDELSLIDVIRNAVLERSSEGVAEVLPQEIVDALHQNGFTITHRRTGWHT
jgi:ribosomal protein S7